MGSGVEPTIEAMRSAARVVDSLTSSEAESAAALQVAQNAVTAQKSVLLADVDARRAHEELGFSSIATLGRVRLGLSPKTTRACVRIGKALAVLPRVREAALAGKLSFEHLKSFDYALRVVDRHATIDSESAMLTLALNLSAEEFHAQLRRLREATLDELDQAWLDGMDKADLRLARTSEGWQVSGFLPIDTGTRLRTILDAAAVPRAAGDTRAPSTRRVEALEAMCQAILEHGLPVSNGFTPQLHVVIDTRDEQVSAKLAKFGPIGPALLAHLAHHGQLTTITVRNRAVLDVGRRRRFATTKQGIAIWHQQDGRCATAGCRHPIAEIDHIVEWAQGGRSDLDNLDGLCRKCHALKTHGKLPPRARPG